MGVFVVVMLLHVSSACQGRVWASRVHFTLDTKKDDTCYNRSTTSTPKQKKEKNKKGSDERGKNRTSGNVGVLYARLGTLKRTITLLLIYKFRIILEVYVF